MRWRISVVDGLAREGLEQLRAEAEVVEDPQLQQLGSVDAIIVRSRTRVTSEVLAGGRPRLRVVGRAGVGVDNVDVPAAASLGIVVVNAPRAATESVAEHTLALLLALAREIPRADAGLKRGAWEKDAFRGIEVAGKTLGLVGVGRIGAALARRAAALDMRILGHDPWITSEAIRAAGAEPSDLESVYAQSDFVSLHLPLNDQTRGLIGRAALQKMKPGAYLLNAARGGVVDEAALLEALESGRLAGAALDVFSEEPPGAGPLIHHPKVIATPHIAAQTHEAQVRAAGDIAEEVLAALRGEPLRWSVTSI